MSYDDYDGSEQAKISGSIERCRPDYEAQAANLKKKLEITTKLEDVLFEFKSVVGVHSFNKISSFAEFIGGVVIKKTEFSNHYEEVLILIEKDV